MEEVWKWIAGFLGGLVLWLTGVIWRDRSAGRQIEKLEASLQKVLLGLQEIRTNLANTITRLDRTDRRLDRLEDRQGGNR